MNRTFVVGALLSAGAALQAQQPAPALSAAPSTRATVAVSLVPPRGTQGVAPAHIRIDYGQPHLRGRSLHVGGLVPLDTIWRFGANEATGLDTEVDLVIGGVAVPKGKYTLFALPSATEWKLIINKNTGQWGTRYDSAHDLARIALRKRTLPESLESFSVWLIPASQAQPPRGELRFAWGNVELATDWSVASP